MIRARPCGPARSGFARGCGIHQIHWLNLTFIMEIVCASYNCKAEHAGAPASVRLPLVTASTARPFLSRDCAPIPCQNNACTSPHPHGNQTREPSVLCFHIEL